MTLHRLTSITLGVPDVAASQEFFADFGLRPCENGWMATRDGGDQVQLTESGHRRLARLGIGAEESDDLERISDRVTSVGLSSIESHTRRLRRRHRPHLDPRPLQTK